MYIKIQTRNPAVGLLPPDSSMPTTALITKLLKNIDEEEGWNNINNNDKNIYKTNS